MFLWNLSWDKMFDISFLVFSGKGDCPLVPWVSKIFRDHVSVKVASHGFCHNECEDLVGRTKNSYLAINDALKNRENQKRSKNKIQGENLRSNTMFVLLRFLILYSGFVQHKFSQIWSNSYNTAGERKIKFENLIASFGTTFHSLVGAQVQQKKY